MNLLGSFRAIGCTCKLAYLYLIGKFKVNLRLSVRPKEIVFPNWIGTLQLNRTDISTSQQIEKRRNFKLVLSLFLFFGLFQPISAQQTPLDLYKKSVPITPEVFNGGQYVEYPNFFLGHAFFQSNAYTYTDIIFNGITYNDVPSLYDLVSQNIVVFNPIHAKKVMIQSNKVSEFTIKSPKGDIRFVKGKLLGIKGEHEEMFLEEIVPERLFAYHKKSIQKEIKELERNSRFDSYENFLILFDEELIAVNGKKDIIQTLAISNKSIRKMLKEKGIKYRTDKRAYYSAIVQERQNLVEDD